MTPTSSATNSAPRANGDAGRVRPGDNADNPGDGPLLGCTFAHALARKDFDQLAVVLHPEIELRALTPRRTWTPENHSDALEVFRTWFGDCSIDEIVRMDCGAFADRRSLAYRFRGDRPEGRFVIEQQAYFCERAGQIDWMRIMCSGFRAP